MGLFDTISNVIRGKAKELEASLEDPIRDGKLAIEDAQKQLVIFKSQIAGVMSQKNKLERELKASKAEVTKYGNYAEKAVLANDDEGATRALEVQSKNEKSVNELKSQLKTISTQIETLRGQMEKNRQRISNAESNIAQLETRQTCVKVREQIAKATEGSNNSDPFAKLDKLEEKIQSQEDSVDALEELNDTGNADEDLDSKYGSGSTSDASDKLAALKAKMAK